ncbi:uncharacterized protein LOC110629991 [Manihot esculenta]|uniref:C2H2-type domain-containing protein n=2 Tax=Manihot esculenta TaxID=3983 RepID=A0A2C9UTB1_MANES|nr:uncharacterized protein LOC110629991 [Manihot esculenta]XP_043805767.1 uncharacterized protein LOC110629991 [Manihot esculenta]KAG8641438.1 hypothetical protein MANES_13G147300v8 [Manihot esculenta]OAY34068.1 hypothetical protein MANES_13G147300v8 [Manihot esculenta]
MAGRWQLGFPKTGASSLKEQLARTTIHNVRSQGHPYVELREDGKRFIFFCTLCLAPCYSDSVLFDHLKGNLHTERLSAAKLTLLKPNPWPFSDGVHFCMNSIENDRPLAITNGSQSRLLESNSNGNNLAIVKYDVNLTSSGNGHVGCNKDLNGNEGTCDLVIPCVLVKDEICNLKTRFVGSGQIAARFCEKDGNVDEIIRIWCEWLGENSSGHEDKVKVLDHEFAVVTFSYNYDLGRKGLLDDVKLLLSSSPTTELENGKGTNRKRKSFSDPEDISESLSNHYSSSGEESSPSNGGSSRLLLDQYDDQLLHSRFISNKTIRRELRRQHRIAAERMCDICQQKMLPEKDVASLINMKTGKLACSSRNVNGAFHVFHTSCLIHWILLCEYEMARNQSVGPKARRGSKRKSGAKSNKAGKDGKVKALKHQIDSVFCPECQGTGVKIEEDELEMPTIPLSEMFKYKIKVSDGRRAWMKSPEVLQNCSTGFHFPSQCEEPVQEKVLPLKRLLFYKADE